MPPRVSGTIQGDQNLPLSAWEICCAASPSEYKSPYDSIASELWERLNKVFSGLPAPTRKIICPIFRDKKDDCMRLMMHKFPEIYAVMIDIKSLVEVSGISRMAGKNMELKEPASGKQTSKQASKQASTQTGKRTGKQPVGSVIEYDSIEDAIDETVARTAINRI